MYELSDFIEVAEQSLDNVGEMDFFKEYETNKGNCKRLKFWLIVDEWTKEEAIEIFLDLDPESTRYLDTGELEECLSFSGNFNIQEILRETVNPEGMIQTYSDDSLFQDCYGPILHDLNKLINDYKKMFSTHESASPTQWLERAFDKGLTIPWYKWAASQKLFDNGTKTSQEQEGAHVDKGTPPNSNKQTDSKKERPLADRERNSLLKTISALAAITQNDDIEFPFKSQNDLISHLVDEYGEYHGISKSSLELHMSEGNKLLKQGW